MNNFAVILSGIFICFSLITYLLHRLFKKTKFIKYIPGVMALVFGLYSFYRGRTINEGFADIAGVLVGIMGFTGFIGALLCGAFLDYKYSK